MGAANAIPREVARVHGRFERWRQGHRSRARIPDSLWSEAVELAREYGVNATARVLRLDYCGLKKRLGGDGGSARHANTETKTGFVELVPAAAGPECVVELENASGAKLKLQLRGHAVPDLITLSHIFWDRA
jgi:hypothetical protein